MPEVVVSNPAAPTLAAAAPLLSDPGSAKAALATNTVTLADSPAAPELSPGVSHTPPVGEAPNWTKDICEICWLPVQGKRPSKKQQKQQKNQNKEKKWWHWKKEQPEDDLEEYWIELPCKHRFGSSCLKEWRKTEDEAAENRAVGMGQARNQCPTCKKGYLHHTCHRKSRAKIVRGYQATKRFLTLSPPEICVKCELDAIDDSMHEYLPYWEHGVASYVVGIVLFGTVPHNQLHGYEPVTRNRQFVLRHLPHSWRDSMEHIWHTKISVGTFENPKEVAVQFLHYRAARKPTKAERKQQRIETKARRKQKRNLVTKSRGNNSNTKQNDDGTASTRSPIQASRVMEGNRNPVASDIDSTGRGRQCGDSQRPTSL
ncbi:hypothetical protein MKZ38_004105 [Zalerion maritima]|uniref:Zinc finger C3HC4 RING-type domain-containing protein n=1 Tax=Zalerion maritima TaxID=339359 RepID=A0AAD5RWL0_9PEZI|nr:hypothetical protein MKZ38_004105 [Zalerion maritima]